MKLIKLIEEFYALDAEQVLVNGRKELLNGHLVLRVATAEEGATASPAVAYVAVFKYGDFEIKINFYQRHVVTANANGEDVLGRGLHPSTFQLNPSRF